MYMDEAISHWYDLAESDYTDAIILLERKRYSGSLLHLQQAVEKVLKALYVKKHKQTPPHTHNLPHLCELVSLDMTKVDMKLLESLSLSYTRLRYPDLDRTFYTDKEKVLAIITFAKHFYLWIKTL